MKNLPTTIDDVLEELDKIIEQSIIDNDHIGIFAYLYRRTTAEVKQAIVDERFEDNEQMEKFDVLFANFYIDAYRKFKNGQAAPKSWEAAFASRNESLTISQHLMMGMNAHINFDLGIAAAQFVPGDKIDGFKKDFMKVNKILKELTNEMQKRLSRVSRLMFLLDWIGQRTDELIVNFSIVKARKQAWKLAFNLAHSDEAEKKIIIEKADEKTSNLAMKLKRPPGFFINKLLKIISWFEEKNVELILSKLRRNK